MHKPAKVVVEKKRDLYTYSELWHASECVLKSGIENQFGSSWQFLSSLLLTVFTFEAYLNHVGIRTIKCWEQCDRLPPWSKFELLCETLEVKFPDNTGARPLQTISKLLDFRNTVAHGRSEIVAKKEIRDADHQLDAYLGERPLADWELLIQTKNFAEQAREDVYKTLERLHEQRKDDKESLFTFGMGVHGASLVEAPG
ncbi:MAG: hypothetical protein WCD07_02725 [Burkholderiales bacterium]